MPTISELFFPAPGKIRPAASTIKIKFGAQVHSLKRWHEIAYHVVSGPGRHRTSPSVLLNTFKKYPLNAGSAGNPIQLTPRDFVRLFKPSPKPFIPEPNHAFFAHHLVPYPLYLAAPPTLRNEAIKEAAEEGFTYLRVLNFIHVAHKDMVLAVHNRLIQDAAHLSSDEEAALKLTSRILPALQRWCSYSHIPGGYLEAHQLPESCRRLLEPRYPSPNPNPSYLKPDTSYPGR